MRHGDGDRVEIGVEVKAFRDFQPGRHRLAIAREQRVALVDMEKLTSGWLQKEGVEASKNFFHKFAPGESLLYPSGLDDNTHFNEAGARIVASLFTQEVKKQQKKNDSITQIVNLEVHYQKDFSLNYN